MTASVERLDEVLEQSLRHSTRRARADLTGVLASITTLAVEQLPGVHHAGVTLVEPATEDGDVDSTEDGRVIRCLAATDGHPLVLDNIVRGCGQGPCLDTITGHRLIRSDDLTVESRWPQFTAKAIICTPVRAILSLPVFRDGRPPVALNLYSDRAGAFDARAEASGALVAAHVAEAMNAAHRRHPVRSARSQIITEAKAMIMAQRDVDVAQAFAILVQMAKQQNESIESVARQVVARNGLTRLN
ncbi:ANTAR domain-containing protein [Mycobacterium sp. PS03-16]|uniref:GAF and ANTAR domain-containing protein n=1 Tax=Mycobacterium sp. PS03-16 TaxID=2559611 RepID=UPI0010734607|nr:GAF and ANTAR domain-containing protein [Mycobacterium sp. PS03-16]TFV57060.1 ANTAR domain-containing protein [Mycobacterium sp. PS03-16]